MTSFIAVLLRIFVSIAIALTVIAGAAAGWFADQVPFLPQQLVPSGDAPAIRAIGAIVGGIGGLIAATLTFGIIATLLDMRDKLIDIRQALQEQPASRRPLDWEKP